MSNEKNETMDNSTVCEMFEEVKALQVKGLKAIEDIRSMSATTSEPAPALNPEDGKRIETLAEKLDSVSEKLDRPLRHHHTLDFMGNRALIALAEKLDNVGEKLDRPLRHHHTLDFMGNRALIALAAAVGALLVSLWIIHNQRGTIARNRDNDLKYRYIQMRGEATTSDIIRLRNVFDFNRNPDSIKIIRRQVEEYERLVKEQAENEIRAKLNDEQAKQLRQEAETVRKGK